MLDVAKEFHMKAIRVTMDKLGSEHLSVANALKDVGFCFH